MLSDGYTDEQKEISAALPKLEKEIQGLKETVSNVDKSISMAKKYTRITDLTPEILHTFVSKIVIHERTERYKQKSDQQIDIYFRHIGNVDSGKYIKGQAALSHFLSSDTQLNKGVVIATLLNKAF